MEKDPKTKKIDKDKQLSEILKKNLQRRKVAKLPKKV